MKSSEGSYYPRLDHVRALAAFLVFFWHFTHAWIPSSIVPSFFPVSLFEEGWTGVALFMTLSGYLFAKIADGKDLMYLPFLWNRFVRLAPLLVAIFIYYAAFHGFGVKNLIKGFVDYRGWPGGAWSLTAEMHFYLVFPLLVLIQRRFGTAALAACLLASVSVRAVTWLRTGETQILAYWTIAGRFDQFVLGMIAFQLSKHPLVKARANWLFAGALFGFALFWHGVNIAGGLYFMPSYPSSSPLWIVIPTIEGLAWGTMIAAYEATTFQMPPRVSAALAHVGEVSYSIYLLHFIFIFDILKPLLPAPASYAEASVLAVALFPVVVAAATLSYKYLERPLLRYRTRYIAQAAQVRPATFERFGFGRASLRADNT
jgi:peptidoglycan/LPS O-acetylase OafA/YrhL